MPECESKVILLDGDDNVLRVFTRAQVLIERKRKWENDPTPLEGNKRTPQIPLRETYKISVDKVLF